MNLWILYLNIANHKTALSSQKNNNHRDKAYFKNYSAAIVILNPSSVSS